MGTLIQENELTFDTLHEPLFVQKDIQVIIARFDKIHPVVSGNKIYKLHYFLQNALAEGISNIITFGGAYSNHLVATAYACDKLQLNCTGIIRGEKPPVMSHSLNACMAYGMKLRFISRNDYKKITDETFLQQLTEEYGRSVIIPEGGFHPLGAKGAEGIIDAIQHLSASHVCVAVGTATTLAGLLRKSTTQTIAGFPALKGLNDITNRINFLTGHSDQERLQIFNDYHFDGYAKYNSLLLQFMNDFYTNHTIPLDFVYTGKMMYGVYDQVKKDFFPPESKIVCIHTGGLQGNLSLPLNTLHY
jgi:1-aminocyclopropane-1-carboxylate deaminase/D-cysteine desulfhydrase-like pyridoxal-dependent ACC family enzyme